MQYLILPTEQEALDRSHEAHETDTMQKMGKTAAQWSGLPPDFVTQYRWARDVGKDGQTALIIDGDVHLLTTEEVTKLVPKLPEGPGENWEKPPPPDMGGVVTSTGSEDGPEGPSRVNTVQ